VTTIAAPGAAGEGSLRRELGRWDLTAIGINQVIGSAVFALPAVLAGSCNGWSPALILAVGIASLLIAMTFAEVGSRFDVTGGPYIYTREAFGRFIGFEIGWVQWFIRVSSWAAVLNVFVAYAGFYWPSAPAGTARVLWMSSIVVSLAAINVLGIKQSAWAVNALTVGKLVPLLLFGLFGLTAMHWAALKPGAFPPVDHLSSSALLLIYGFGGYETILIPAGESRAPRTGVPFALVTTIVVVAAIFVLIQVV
jgi:APA family basic amino acid/polyamine antiporter